MVLLNRVCWLLPVAAIGVSGCATVATAEGDGTSDDSPQVELKWEDANVCAAATGSVLRPQEQALIQGAIPAILAGIAIKYALDQIDDVLSAELKRYTATYAGTMLGEAFYECNKDDGTQACTGIRPAQRPKLRNNCFSVKRTDHGRPSLRFVGMFDTTNDEHMDLVPLTLDYYCGAYEAFDQRACQRNGSPEKFPDEINLAISARITAWWQENWGSDTRVVYDGALVAATVRSSGSRFGESECVWMQNNDDASRYYHCDFRKISVKSAYVPVSRIANRMNGSSEVDFNIVVTEAEKPPGWLTWTASKFHSNKDKLADQAVKAIGKSTDGAK